MKISFPIIALIVLVIITCWGCDEEYVPKPRGYFRIDLPERGYRLYDSLCPFTFEYSKNAIIVKDPDPQAEPCWFNIFYPQFRGSIYLSYKNIDKNLPVMLEETRAFVYKHTVKADAINENVWENKENKIYGILYDIKGNAASSLQFFLTDSTRHFIRGALYFDVKPNKDSIAPVLDFVRKDIQHLVETFRWKEK